MLRRLGSDSAAVRMFAARSLGRSRANEAVSALIGLLTDDSADVRRTAAHALGRIRERRALAPLVAVLRDPDSQVRARAAEALGRLGDVDAVGPLTSLANKDANETVRWYAVRGLGEMREWRPVIPRFADEDRGVRREAVVVVGRFGDDDAIEPLQEALQQENDRGLRNVVMRSLRSVEARQDAPHAELPANRIAEDV
jgi:HEAT repeat protein